MNDVKWRKASGSSANGGDCVELAVLEDLRWRKASSSNSNGGNCVELAVIEQ
jgi:hypothetical protein